MKGHLAKKKIKRVKKETKKMQEKKEKGTFLTNPPSEKFVWRQALLQGLVMHCPKNLDIVGKTHRFNKQCFIRLKCVEAINLFLVKIKLL